MKKFRHVREGFNADGTVKEPELNSPPVHDYVAGKVEELRTILQEDYPLERAGTLGEVIDRRVQVYGDPIVGFAEIAEMWTTYLGFPVQAHQVPIMMLLMKVVRSKTSPDYSDHIDDIKGYADIFEKVIGEDMIHARSVSEYIEKKWPGES